MEAGRISLNYLLNCLSEHTASSTSRDTTSSNTQTLRAKVLSDIPVGAVASTGGVLVLHPTTWPLSETIQALESYQRESGQEDVMCCLLPLSLHVAADASSDGERLVKIGSFEHVVLLFKDHDKPELLESEVNRYLLFRVVREGEEGKLQAHFVNPRSSSWLEAVKEKGWDVGKTGEFIRRYIAARVQVMVIAMLNVFVHSRDHSGSRNETAEAETLDKIGSGAEWQWQTPEGLKVAQVVVHKAVIKKLISALCQDGITLAKRSQNEGETGLLSVDEEILLEKLANAALKDDEAEFNQMFRQLSSSFERFNRASSLAESALQPLPAAAKFMYSWLRFDAQSIFPAYCSLLYMLNERNVLNNTQQLDQAFKVGTGMLPSLEASPVLALVAAFLPAYQRSGRLPTPSVLTSPQAFAETKRNVQPDVGGDVAILGGGPSSLLPFVAASKSGGGVRFFGKPSQSFVICGRDPQKTIPMMLHVAQKYESYKALEEQTVLYYRYIAALVDYFGDTPEEAVRLVYDLAGPMPPKGFTRQIALYSEAKDEFIPVSLMEDGTLYLQSKKGQRLRVYKSMNGAFQYGDGLEVELPRKVTVVIPNAAGTAGRTASFEPGLHLFRYLPKNHGDLHYLTLFADVWEDPADFTRIKQGFKFVVNRASFAYPTDSVKATMTALNYDYVECVANCLKRSSKGLVELEQRLLRLLSEFLENAATNRAERLAADSFVLFGCGRASGEMARRLAHDELRFSPKASCGLPHSLYSGVDHRVVKAEEDKLRGLIGSRQKRVVMVDHKKIDLDRDDVGERVRELVLQSSSYVEFIYEITKGSFVPLLSLEDLDYYRRLKAHTQADPELQNEVHELDFLQDLGRLCDQKNTSANFRLKTHNTRDVKPGSEEMSRLISLNPADPASSDEWVVLRVGGAKQEGEPILPGYNFLRINSSHFRSENLGFLNLFVPKQDSKPVSFSDIVMNNVLQSTEMQPTATA